MLEKARFAWRCRRGMLELDLILQGFLEKGFDRLTPQHIKDFDALLQCTDPELYAWFMGHEVPQELKEIVRIIRDID